MIVVLAETGEYENRSERIFGVFKDMATAENAVSEARKRSPEKWSTYWAWDKRRAEILSTYDPANISTGSIFPNGEWRSYRDEQYARAKAKAGPEPEFGFLADTVRFYEVELDRPYDNDLDAVKELQFQEK